MHVYVGMSSCKVQQNAAFSAACRRALKTQNFARIRIIVHRRVKPPDKKTDKFNVQRFQYARTSN